MNRKVRGLLGFKYVPDDSRKHRGGQVQHFQGSNNLQSAPGGHDEARKDPTLKPATAPAEKKAQKLQ